MIVILGLIILLAAVVVGVAGVTANTGSAHALTSSFSVFGYHVTGSTGTLFLSGIIVGAAALLGLSLLLAGARRRPSGRGRTTRPGLRTHRETVSADDDREGLTDQRETTRTETADARANDSPQDDRPADPDGSRRSRPHWFGRRSAPR